MASTIKLKNSTTAGNSPSSLSQGEVAINVADGGLFYGTTGGTSVSSSLSISHLTASGNISSSGTVFTTNIATPDIPSGNQTGTPITIKAGRGFGSGATAGALFLRTSQGMGTGLGGNITLQPGGGGSGGEAKSGSLNLNSPKININGAITASGDISSSGNIITDKIVAGIFPSDNLLNLHDDNVVNANGVTLSSIGSMVFMLDSNDTGTVDKFEFRADSQDASAGNLLATIEDNGDFTAEGHITASGNISSSGNVAGLSGSFSHIVLEDNSRIVAKNSPSTTYIELQNDDGFQFRANNTEVFTVFSNGAVFNDLGVAQADFRIESDNDTHIFFVDSGNDKVAIGTDTVGSSLLTVDGDITATDITASGTISASIIKSNNIVGDTSQNTQLFVGGAITASGDISSSANVIAQHITASGNIRGTMPQIISANMGSVNLSTENFIPLAEGEIEGTNGDHPRVNLIAPFSGSLRRVVMRSNAAFGTSEFTASLHTIRPGGALSSDKDTVGQCFVDTTGDNNAYAVVFDFTNSVVGSNVIDGGDRVLIGVESTRTNSQNYFFTSVFTWDYQETTGLQTTSTSTSGGSI